MIRRLGESETDPIEDDIWEEISADWKGNYPNIAEAGNDIIGSFLNNFFLKLLAVTSTEMMRESQPWVFSEPERTPLDGKSEWVETNEGEDAKTALIRLGHSEKYLTETSITLWQNIKIAIDESGVDETSLKNYLENYQRSSSKEATERLLFPVYIQLRKMGYTHEDLRTG
ncbi:hypothetical protein HOG48_02195 [Candidatus Peregrinibacteria bacterium]|jgi:hypothetical protein|nr:hypothetical protein [Candidatus Peregrinibacteria bacterium]